MLAMYYDCKELRRDVGSCLRCITTERFGFVLWWHTIIAPFYSQHPQPSNPMSPITPNMIINAAKSMVNLPHIRNNTFNRRWKSSFGAPPEVCCELWNKIDPYKTMPAGVDPKHILWALLFLTVYDTEHNSAQRLGNMDEKTYRNGPNSLSLQYHILNAKW